MSADSGFRILELGLEDKARQLIEASCAGATITMVSNADEFAEKFEGWRDGDFNAIFCGGSLEGMSANELAQVLLNQCPETLKYYVTYDTANYEPKILIKNGFTQAFALPMDLAFLKKTIRETVTAAAKNEKVYKSVKIFDLEGGEKLDFETYVFLPLNNKYVRFTGANQALDDAKLEKLSRHHVNNVFVDTKDIQKFYQYSAKRMRDLGGVSSTEKQEKLQDCVRSLFTDMFDQSIKGDFNEGKERIQQVEGIISNYITKGASGDWYKRLLSSMGESGDNYSHASNVSTFAALFAIGIGHPNPEDLAMAGLFHDLGLAQLPEELLEKPEKDWTEEERKAYHSHPEKSLNVVKTKRLIVSPSVERAIAQHHEAFSGRGYPKGLPGNRISEEAQILSLADQFDYLTRIEPGKPRVTPLEALEKIKATGSINPELLSKVRKILDKESGSGPKPPTATA